MDNAQVIDRINQEAFNAGNADILDELVADDFVEHDPMPDATPDREGFKKLIRELRTAFPDLHLEVEEQVVAGDRVVERWVCTGTHEGMFMGIAPTHRHVEIRGMDMSRLQDGRLAEHWTNADMLGMLQQLGVVPSGAPA
jgi:steroid delta-isomerase-like uncharacterized protein